jgi:hypothetical protein
MGLERDKRDNSRPAHGSGTHAAINPSYRALVTGTLPGQQFDTMHAW